MNQKVYNQLVSAIFLQKEGVLIFKEDFHTLGSEKAVGKGLERLVNHGILSRVARGIYLLTKKDKELGGLMPSLDKIAHAIAEREKAIIAPSGLVAMNDLGLSNQIPMNAVYFTNATPRKIKVGNRTIVFKKTTPKKLALRGKISTLVIRAMQEIGKEHFNEEYQTKIKEWILKEKNSDFLFDVKLAPFWIRSILMEMRKDT
ncbi:MAG: hypothetical protein KA767_14440 [Saprospiraceae bacterium]|jgi:hypothetical protein|nr:hypothetical protein [Saprospiraceae bacterium]